MFVYLLKIDFFNFIFLNFRTRLYFIIQNVIIKKLMRKFKSKEIIKKRRKLFLKRIYLSFFSFLLIVLVFSFLSFWENINFKNIEVIGEEEISEKEVLTVIEKHLEGKYIYLFSKKNIFIYPKEKIISELKNEFLKIDKLSIYRKDWTTLVVDFTERKPFALYCQNEEIENDGILDKKENCFLMDKDGFIYDEALNFTKNVYFKYEEEKNLGKEKILASVFLENEKEFFEKINLFVRFLKDINVDVYHLYIKGNDDCKLFFNNNAYLMFDKKQDLNFLLENLKTVLISLGDLEGKEFDYIDLRFGNKIYYKFKDENQKELKNEE